jgi:hypothetical protein
MGREASEGRCRVLVKETALDPGVLDLAVSRFSYGAKPVSPRSWQSSSALQMCPTLKLIPKPIRVADAARQAHHATGAALILIDCGGTTCKFSGSFHGDSRYLGTSEGAREVSFDYQARSPWLPTRLAMTVC